MDFDQTRLYFSHQQLQRQPDGADEERQDNADENQDDDDENNVDPSAVRRHFREFLRKFYWSFLDFRWRPKLSLLAPWIIQPCSSNPVFFLYQLMTYYVQVTTDWGLNVTFIAKSC